jgi:hypothetical protein
VAWLRNETFWGEPVIRSQAFGPSLADARDNLISLATECRKVAAAFTEIGSREFTALARASEIRGKHFEPGRVVPGLRDIAKTAEEAAALIKIRRSGGRRPRPQKLVLLAEQIAQKMREAGAEPTTTLRGDFDEILSVLIDALNVSWPAKSPLRISAARAALPGGNAARDS